MSPVKIKWETVVDIKSSVLTMSLNSLGLKRKYINKALDIDFEYKTCYYFETKLAYSGEDLGGFFSLVQKKLSQDKNYLFTFPKRVSGLADNLLNFSKKIQKTKNLEKFTDKGLEKLFSELFEKAALAFPLLLISIPIEIIVSGELEKFVREKLKKANKINKFEDYFQTLTQRSTKETFFQQDYRKLLRIGVEIQKNKKLLKKIRSNSPSQVLKFLKINHPKIHLKLIGHNQEYAWINMYLFRRDPFTNEEFVGRLKDILEKDCNKELKRIETNRKKTEKSFNKIIKSLNIKGELKNKSIILSEYVYLRTYRLDIFSLAAYLTRNLLLKIASRFKLTYDELTHLTLWEIQDLLLGKKLISQIPVKERMKAFAIIQIDGKFDLITNKKQLDQLRVDRKTPKQKQVKVIKGNVASKGKAVGPVKIVMHPTQITKIEKGDVLVAPMTSPDFVVGMLKAVAIVTDHGGITCHAAIVSRELGVPCVIATGNATQVLKDGEIVEVDAEKGIIRRV